MIRSILLTVLAAVWSLQAAVSEAAEVSIDNFTFAPAELTIKAGDTVTFVNHDDIPHSVVGKNSAFRSKVLDTDERFAFTFSNTGEFAFFCGLHPHMTGRVIVTP